MRDKTNFEGVECAAFEAEIRAMCGKLKLAAPPSEYSLEDAIKRVIGDGAMHPKTGWLPVITAAMGGFYHSLSRVFTAQRLSNVASSIIVFMMLMIIPLALFSNRGMAMNTEGTQAHNWEEGTSANDDFWKLECTKYLCGDERYEK